MLDYQSMEYPHMAPGADEAPLKTSTNVPSYKRPEKHPNDEAALLWE